MDSRPVTSPVHAGPYQPSRKVGNPSLPQPSLSKKLDTLKKLERERKEELERKEALERERNEETKKKQVVVWRKVCEHCGKVFNRCQPYLFHVRTHRPMLRCDVCRFCTKDSRKFKAHKEVHTRDNPQEACNVCKARFASERSLKVHMRRIHGIIRCKDCLEAFIGEEVYASHREEVHNDPIVKKGFVSLSDLKRRKHVNIFKDPQPSSSRSEYVCRLCNKESRNKYQLKIHIAQHLGVNSDKISDEFLATQDLDKFEYEVAGFTGLDRQKRQSRQDNSSPDEENYLGMSHSHEWRNEDTSKKDDQINLGMSHSHELKNEDPSKKDDQVVTSALDIPIKKEPIDVPYDQSNNSLSAPSNDDFPFVAVAKEEPPDPAVFQPPTFDSPQNLPPTHNLIATSLDSSMLDLQQSMLRSLHSMIFPAANVMTSLPITSMPSTSFAISAPSHMQLVTDPSTLSSVNNLTQKRKVRIRKPRLIRIKPKVYCNECPQEFSSYKQLQKHQVKHRNEELRKSFTCPLCEKTSLSAVRMSRHFKSQHKDKLRCRYHCAVLFSTKEEVFTHYKEVHKVETTVHACPHCGLEYLMEGFLLNHLERCTKCPPEKRPVHVCGNCQAILRTRREYNFHIRTCVLSSTDTKDGGNSSEGFVIANERPMDEYEGLEVNDGIQEFEFANKKPMDEYNSLEIMGNIQEAPQTDMNLSEENMSLGLLRKPKEYPYECKFCKLGFEDMQVAVEHCYSTHLNKVKQMSVQRHICQECGIEVSSKLSFCKHMLNHYRMDDRVDDIVPRNLMEIAYAKNYCWICRFTLQGNIHRHLNQRNKSIEFYLNNNLTEPDTTSFGCTYCLEHFASRYDYWKHVKRHLNELSFVGVYPLARESVDSSEPYECSICLLIFTDGEEFYKHLATHAVFCHDWRKRQGREVAVEKDETGKESEEKVDNEERQSEEEHEERQSEEENEERQIEEENY